MSRNFTIKSIRLNRTMKRGLSSGKKARFRALQIAYEQAHKSNMDGAQYGACITWRKKIQSFGYNRIIQEYNHFKESRSTQTHQQRRIKNRRKKTRRFKGKAQSCQKYCATKRRRGSWQCFL